MVTFAPNKQKIGFKKTKTNRLIAESSHNVVFQTEVATPNDISFYAIIYCYCFTYHTKKSKTAETTAGATDQNKAQ